MNVKFFSVLLCGIVLIAGVTVTGTSLQLQHPADTQDQDLRQPDDLLSHECDCEQQDIGNTDINYYRTGILPGGEPLPPGEVFIGSVASVWDWRSATHNNHTGDWTTPIRNQGNCGSCYAFGPLASIEALIKITHGNPDYAIDLSEQYMVSCGSEWMSGSILGCQGAYAPGYFNFITTYDALPESCFPYVSGSGSVPPCANKCSTWEELLIDIGNWHTVAADQTSIKNALLQHGPLSAGMVVYSDFQGYNGGVYEHPGNDPDPINHAVCLVGYDDAQGCWIGKNSWGTFWGEDGWFKIAYGDCKIEQQVIYYDYVAQTGPQISVKMHRVLGIGAIETWLEGEADWSYRIQVHTGSQWTEQINDAYSSNENDHTEDVTHRFSVQTMTPEITIKLWDRDILSGDDLADVSGYPGGGTDNSITDVRGAIFHCQYNMMTNEVIQIDTIIVEGSYLTTAGTYQPDGGQNPDEENDAKVWFQLTDTYEPPTPDLEVTGTLEGSVKHGTTQYTLGTFTVENIGVDPFGFATSYLDWEVAETPTWGSNWVLQPASGTNLPAGQTVTVTVSVDVPSQQGTFSGQLKLWNTENHADYDIVPISLESSTDDSTGSSILFLKRGLTLQQSTAFPLLFYILIKR